MRNAIVEHGDGFGRDLENPENLATRGTAMVGVEMGQAQKKQNVFYVHGALPFFDAGVDIVKEECRPEKLPLGKNWQTNG